MEIALRLDTFMTIKIAAAIENSVQQMSKK